MSYLTHTHTHIAGTLETIFPRNFVEGVTSALLPRIRKEEKKNNHGVVTQAWSGPLASDPVANHELVPFVQVRQWSRVHRHVDTTWLERTRGRSKKEFGSLGSFCCGAIRAKPGWSDGRKGDQQKERKKTFGRAICGQA